VHVFSVIGELSAGGQPAVNHANGSEARCSTTYVSLRALCLVSNMANYHWTIHPPSVRLLPLRRLVPDHRLLAPRAWSQSPFPFNATIVCARRGRCQAGQHSICNHVCLLGSVPRQTNRVCRTNQRFDDTTLQRQVFKLRLTSMPQSIGAHNSIASSCAYQASAQSRWTMTPPTGPPR
jgi:hypothetical protein